MRQTLLVSKMGLCCCVLSFSTLMALNAGAAAGPVLSDRNQHSSYFTAQLTVDIPLKGKVVTTRNEGLPGVTVLLTEASGRKQGATTNENGEFSFSALEAGKNTIWNSATSVLKNKH